MAATIENEKTISPDLANELVFSYYPAYARFIRQYHIVDYIKEAIRLSREVNLPILQYVSHIPDEQLIEMGLPKHIEFLESVENNTLSQLLQEGLKRWENDELEIIGKDDLAADDIALTSYIRKQSLLKFLHLYTADVNEILRIIREIDMYEMEAGKAATQTYINILHQKIYRHSRFIESITNTTPSIIYVYDCIKEKEVYTNSKMTEFLGYTPEDLGTLGDVIEFLVHPADLELVKQHNKAFASISDGEIRYLEFRVRTKSGIFRWMRTNEAVFSRNADGSVHEKIGIAVDIDSQKHAEDLLHQKESQLLEAQELVNIGSYVWDIETNEVTVTPQYRKIFEIKGEVNRDELLKGVHPGDFARITAIRENAIANNSEFEYEHRQNINGKEKVLWSRGNVIETPNGKIAKGTIMDITDRNYMLQRLQRSEVLFKQAQAMTHIGNWVWDLVNEKLEWSEELYKIYGIQQGSEINYELIHSYNHPDDIEKVRSTMEVSLKTLEPHDFHYRIISKQNEVLTLHAKGEVITGTDGKPIKMIGTLQDVTEKQAMIEKLQLNESLYKQAQAMSHVGNWTWDIETGISKWSDELFRIFGLEPQSEDISFERYLSFIQPYEHEKVKHSIQNSLATLEPFENIYHAVLPGGEEKIIQSRGEVKTGANGKPVKMYGTCQDVTRQKTTEQKLQQNQEFIQKITDVTPSVITTYNIKTGKYTFVNKGAELLLGYTAEELMENGIPFVTSLIHPDDLSALAEKNEAAIAEANNQQEAGENEIVAEFKYRVKNKSGEYKWLHTYGTVFDRDEHGHVEHILNVSVDITEQERAEQALNLRNIQLQQSNASLEEYAYVASHDLKEPLRKISTFGDRLITSYADKLDGEGQVYLSKIINASERMQTMINDLLSISMIYGNRSFEKFSLQEVLEEVKQTLEYKIEELNATIISDSLPVINGVPSQFRQLLQNMLSNSLKFMRKGIAPEIQISHKYLLPSEVNNSDLVKTSRYLQITIADNGIGFDNNYAAKIFNIFQRLHGKHEYEGNGIGLAICKKVMENHGGTIYAKSTEGRGSEFHIIIPNL